MTNSEKKYHNVNSTNFYQMDIPRVVLSGAKIHHNAFFLSDFIEGDKNKFIQRNRNAISRLNAASFERKTILSGSILLRSKRGLVACTINGHCLFNKSIENNPVFLTLDPHLKIISIVNKYSFQKNGDTYDSYLMISTTGGILCFEWTKNDKKFVMVGTPDIHLSSKEVYDIFDQINVPIENGKIRRVSLKKVPNYLLKVLNDLSKMVIMFYSNDGSIPFVKLEPVLRKAGLEKSLEKKSFLLVFSGKQIYFKKVGSSCLQKDLNIDKSLIRLISCRAERRVMIEKKGFAMNRKD